MKHFKLLFHPQLQIEMKTGGGMVCFCMLYGIELWHACQSRIVIFSVNCMRDEQSGEQENIIECRNLSFLSWSHGGPRCHIPCISNTADNPCQRSAVWICSGIAPTLLVSISDDTVQISELFYFRIFVIVIWKNEIKQSALKKEQIH